MKLPPHIEWVIPKLKRHIRVVLTQEEALDLFRIDRSTAVFSAEELLRIVTWEIPFDALAEIIDSKKAFGAELTQWTKDQKPKPPHEITEF